jgi:signal transduction histidine kinase
MIHRLWSSIGVAPRIAMVIALTFVAAQLVDRALRILVPPPGLLIVDRSWFADAAIEAQRAASSPDPAHRMAALSSLGSTEWLDFRIEPNTPSRRTSELPDSITSLDAELSHKLDLDSGSVIVTAAPFGSPLRAATSGVVILPNLPVLHNLAGADKIQNDVPLMTHFKVGIRLPDQSWLIITQRQGNMIGARHLRNLAILIGVLLFIGGLSLWMARALVAPLKELAIAAERLGREREPTPIGPMSIPEYATIARAFNQMQSRLKSFVDDRTNMLAAISHDLRTPLTRLRLVAEDVTVADLKGQILSDISEMEAMIKSSLAFASDEARREPHTVVDIASLLISLCDNFADMGGDVVYHGPDHAPLPCQPVAMRRALANLIDNGVRYGDRVAITLHDRAHTIVITIRDVGPGIAPNQVERAFSPFQRLDSSRNRTTGGTGLGLTIARDVIRGHGGDITLSLATPQGLLVEVALPKPMRAHPQSGPLAHNRGLGHTPA